MSDAVLWVGLAVGFASALAALYGRYRDLPAWLAGSATCPAAVTCQAVFRTPRAAVLGVPNALLAAAFYPLVGTGLRLGWPLSWLLGAASLALALSVFLAWSLISRKLACRICWAGHAANLVIWGVLVLRGLSLGR